jgi:hypothetical protein
VADYCNNTDPSKYNIDDLDMDELSFEKRTTTSITKLFPFQDFFDGKRRTVRMQKRGGFEEVPLATPEDFANFYKAINDPSNSLSRDLTQMVGKMNKLVGPFWERARQASVKPKTQKAQQRRAKVHQLQTEVRAKGEELEQATLHVIDLTKEKEALVVENNASVAELQSLREEKEALEALVVEMNASVAELQSLREEKDVEENASVAQLQSLREELQHLRQEFVETEQRLEQLVDGVFGLPPGNQHQPWGLEPDEHALIVRTTHRLFRREFLEGEMTISPPLPTDDVEVEALLNSKFEILTKWCNERDDESAAQKDEDDDGRGGRGRKSRKRNRKTARGGGRAAV